MASNAPDLSDTVDENATSTTEAEPAEPEQESATGTDASPDIEERARQLGWKPKDEYRGDPATWRDAQEFVDMTESVTPILRENLRRLSTQLSKTEQKVDSQDQEIKAWRAFTSEALEAERKRVIAEYEQKQRDAVREGDLEAYEALDKQKKAAAEKPEKPVQSNEMPPDAKQALTDFERENDWYGTHDAMTDYARAESDRIAQRMPHLDPEAHLKKVKARVMEAFPDYFSRGKTGAGSQPAGQASVERSRRVPAGGKKQSYENMPREYQAACDRAVKRGMCSKDDFVKTYYKQMEG